MTIMITDSYYVDDDFAKDSDGNINDHKCDTLIIMTKTRIRRVTLLPVLMTMPILIMITITTTFRTFLLP